MTVRLYYDDPALLEFDATVVACEAAADAFRVALDRSAFYPSSGGQPFDTGRLVAAGSDVAVSDVSADGDMVWHTAAMPIPEGTQVRGLIDAARRNDYRQQHSGQHVLSASFDRLLGARTESVHLGDDGCTVDLHREIAPEEAARAEEDANAIVWENRDVIVRYAEGDELETERLRRPTKRAGRVRLIDIAGHDLSACGGTHVTRTGEIGIVAIRGLERFRGGTRVTFLCGGRVLASYRQLRDAADAGARLLSVGVTDLPAAVSRARDDLKGAQRALRDANVRLAAFEAASLETRFEAHGVLQLLVAHLSAADANALRQAAVGLVATPRRVVVLVGGDAPPRDVSARRPYQDAPHADVSQRRPDQEGRARSPSAPMPASPRAIVVARSADLANVDANQVLQRLIRAYGGKGGGRSDLAQAGGITASVDAITADVRALV